MIHKDGTKKGNSAIAYRARAALLPLREISLKKWVSEKTFALIAIIPFFPVMALIGIALRFHNRGRIFFAHARIAKASRIFRCFRFRTMRIDADARNRWLFEICPNVIAEWEAIHELESDPRAHPLERLLRCINLDALPRFRNVLIGGMSIVSPRPIVSEEVGKYGHNSARYCSVRPGVNGAWQVGSQIQATYDAMHTDCVRNATLSEDIRIAIKNVSVVLRRSGAV